MTQVTKVNHRRLSPCVSRPAGQLELLPPPASQNTEAASEPVPLEWHTQAHTHSCNARNTHAQRPMHSSLTDKRPIFAPGLRSRLPPALQGERRSPATLWRWGLSRNDQVSCRVDNSSK